MTSFKINGKAVTIDADADTPLLWVIRDDAGLTGTKFGCGIGMCGACTVHIGGKAARSCITPLSAVEGAEITTIEGSIPKVRTRSRKRGRTCRCHSAATASLDRSCRRRRC